MTEKLYEAQTEKDRLLMLLAQAPAGMKLKQIVMQFGSKPTNYVGKLLTYLKQDGDAENIEKGVWKITQAGFDKITSKPLPLDDTEPVKKVAESGGVIAPSIPDTKLEAIGIPGGYEKFQEIGRSLGIQENFLKVVCDHIFMGDSTDLDYVWQSLEGMYLRPDVTRRWFNLWARAVNKPVPTRIASEVTPERWTIVNNMPVRDPEGEYTFAQALQALRPTPSGDNTAAILTALVNLIEKTK